MASVEHSSRARSLFTHPASTAYRRPSTAVAFAPPDHVLSSRDSAPKKKFAQFGPHDLSKLCVLLPGPSLNRAAQADIGSGGECPFRGQAVASQRKGGMWVFRGRPGSQSGALQVQRMKGSPADPSPGSRVLASSGSRTRLPANTFSCTFVCCPLVWFW